MEPLLKALILITLGLHRLMQATLVDDSQSIEAQQYLDRAIEALKSMDNQPSSIKAWELAKKRLCDILNASRKKFASTNPFEDKVLIICKHISEKARNASELRCVIETHRYAIFFNHGATICNDPHFEGVITCVKSIKETERNESDINNLRSSNYQLGHQALRKGNKILAIKYFTDELLFLQQTGRDKIPNYNSHLMNALDAIIETTGNMQEFKETLTHCQKALDDLKSQKPITPLQLAKILQLQSFIYLKQNKIDEGVRKYFEGFSLVANSHVLNTEKAKYGEKFCKTFSETPDGLYKNIVIQLVNLHYETVHTENKDIYFSLARQLQDLCLQDNGTTLLECMLMILETTRETLNNKQLRGWDVTALIKPAEIQQIQQDLQETLTKLNTASHSHIWTPPKPGM